MATDQLKDDPKVAGSATDEDEIVAVEEEPKPKGDKRLSEAGDDDEDLGPEAEGASEEEREAIREKRREERRSRRERRAKAIERDKRDLDALTRRNRDLEARLEAIEGRTLQQDAREIDQRLSQVSQEYQRAEAAIVKATQEGNGDLLVRAMRVRDEAAEKARQLRDVKGRITAAPAPRQEGPDPVVARLATDWTSENTWYDPSGRDQDSKIVATIDATLAEEGFDPRSEEYWDELDRRVEKALPHRFQKKSGTRSSPPVGGGREQPSRSTRTEVYISPARKQAMIDAGIWDDPERRRKALKAYHDYDKQNPTR